MKLRCKKPRPLIREEKTYRDDRLFVIATEDTYAPEQYFIIFRNPRIKLHVLPTTDSGSSPDHVLDRLDTYIKEYEKNEDDEFWLMLDTDHWIEPNHVQNFTRVCSEAIKKKYGLAHSNPCFEVWLLLHMIELDENDQFGRAADVETRLREILGEYNKRNIKPEHFSCEIVPMAVERAKKLDIQPTDRWPQKTGSHVYRIVEKLLKGLPDSTP